MQDDSHVNKILDLLNGSAGLDSILPLSSATKKAVTFLEQEKMAIKNIQKNCGDNVQVDVEIYFKI